MTTSLMISGHLGHVIFKHLLERGFDIQAVFTNKGSDAIIDLAREKSLPLFVGNPRKGRTTEFIQNIECDVLLSVNYLFIIEQDLIDLPHQYAINIHGSLLPKYRGRTPHVWAIINGEKETGITAHLIDKEVDNGDIIQQVKVPITPTDTGADILKKYKALYPRLAESILNSVENNTIKFTPQEKENAIYFGKRTPADGQIIWDWGKERIQNWVRAQAKPYPGAFTFFGEHKIIAHKAIFSDLGFNYEQKNGEILQLNDQSITVKTPNGALTLQNLETNGLDRSIIKIGMILK